MTSKLLFTCNAGVCQNKTDIFTEDEYLEHITKICDSYCPYKCGQHFDEKSMEEHLTLKKCFKRPMICKAVNKC